jgi:hypothetical protein
MTGGIVGMRLVVVGPLWAEFMKVSFVGVIPPSALPGISPTRGEIDSWRGFRKN